MTTENRTVAIHLLPPEAGLESRDSIAVIVDILRASTTITSALVSGADCVYPCLTIEEARAIARENAALLGGERGGVKVEGFDLGNSPSAYSAEVVQDRQIAFTTTNGTKALHRSLNAGRIIVGSFTNLTATVSACLLATGPVEIVCAGTDGVVSGEDVLFAGLLATQLCDCGSIEPANDAARIAMDFSKANTENPSLLLKTVRASQGGQNLIKLGYDADIEFAANIDRFSVVPVYDAGTRSIRAS